MKHYVLFLLVLLPEKLHGRTRIVGLSWGTKPWGVWSWMGWLPWTEEAHDYYKRTTVITRYLNGTDYTVPPWIESPDYRLPEPPWIRHKEYFFKEVHRPYRLSPFFKQIGGYKYYNHWEFISNLGCICTTVFKRLTPLAGCAILTSRHLLTTATATELVLKRYRHRATVENILGAWYDNPKDVRNSSLYTTPSRIHYHQGYTTLENTNRSHPIPCMHDLSVWAATYRFIRQKDGDVIVCNRASSGRYVSLPSTPKANDLLFLVGYQYVWVLNRRPAPWFKYTVRVRNDLPHLLPVCPKSEWGWFHCIPGDRYAKLGFDVGGALHAAHEHKDWRTDGLIGLNSFSMRLRSVQIMNYFTVLDTQPNIGFYYAAYMGRLPYQFLDQRFENTQFKAPRLLPGNYIEMEYVEGFALDYRPQIFWYKK